MKPSLRGAHPGTQAEAAPCRLGPVGASARSREEDDLLRLDLLILVEQVEASRRQRHRPRTEVGLDGSASAAFCSSPTLAHAGAAGHNSLRELDQAVHVVVLVIG
jgi:hypothetical protein